MSKIKKPFWKRWWFLTIFVIILISIGGANNDSNENSNANDNESISADKNNSKKEVKEFFSIGEEVKLNDNILIVNGIDKSYGNEWDKPKEGKEFIIVNVTIRNGGSSEITFNPFDFELQNNSGEITNITFTTIDNDTSLQSGSLAPNGQTSGTITFEAPIDDPNLVLKYNSNIFSNKEIKVKLN